MKLVAFFIFFVYCFRVVHLVCPGWEDHSELSKVIFRGTLTCINSTFFPVDLSVRLLSACPSKTANRSVVEGGNGYNIPGNCKKRLRELPVEIFTHIALNVSYAQPVLLYISYKCISEATELTYPVCQTNSGGKKYEGKLANSTVTAVKEYGHDYRAHTFDAGKIVLPEIY